MILGIPGLHAIALREFPEPVFRVRTRFQPRGPLDHDLYLLVGGMAWLWRLGRHPDEPYLRDLTRTLAGHVGAVPLLDTVDLWVRFYEEGDGTDAHGNWSALMPTAVHRVSGSLDELQLVRARRRGRTEPVWMKSSAAAPLLRVRLWADQSEVRLEVTSRIGIYAYHQDGSCLNVMMFSGLVAPSLRDLWDHAEFEVQADPPWVTTDAGVDPYDGSPLGAAKSLHARLREHVGSLTPWDEEWLMWAIDAMRRLGRIEEERGTPSRLRGQDVEVLGSLERLAKLV